MAREATGRDPFRDVGSTPAGELGAGIATVKIATIGAIRATARIALSGKTWPVDHASTREPIPPNHVRVAREVALAEMEEAGFR